MECSLRYSFTYLGNKGQLRTTYLVRNYSLQLYNTTFSGIIDKWLKDVILKCKRIYTRFCYISNIFKLFSWAKLCKSRSRYMAQTKQTVPEGNKDINPNKNDEREHEGWRAQWRPQDTAATPLFIFIGWGAHCKVIQPVADDVGR